MDSFAYCFSFGGGLKIRSSGLTAPPSDRRGGDGRVANPSLSLTLALEQRCRRETIGTRPC
jgi:hypothetical protein